MSDRFKLLFNKNFRNLIFFWESSDAKKEDKIILIAFFWKKTLQFSQKFLWYCIPDLCNSSLIHITIPHTPWIR